MASFKRRRRPTRRARRAERLGSQFNGEVAKNLIHRPRVELLEDRFKVTSRVITSRGACCRIVGDDLPFGSREVMPTLEDAYIYCMAKGEG